MSRDADQQQVLESFLTRFGLSEFRPGQREVVAAVLAGKDCLCIMPTGGGKSLCYQLPSIARDGVTLVVSPLIALMKDQVDALQRKGFRADYLNSSLIPSEQVQRLDRLRDGEYDLLYVAPERFRSPRFVQAAIQARIQLLAVDEAHCISEWGHDFRHDYARLGQFRKRLGNPQTIALTATATPNVREDVVKQLAMDDPEIFIAGFARPNLEFSVIPASTRSDKERELVRLLRRTPGCGIIYSSTRKGCDQIAEAIHGQTPGAVGIYHAGLSADDRRAAQEDFMSGKISIVVATNAFGMGIDKADVRFVVHYNMPGTLEAYYQEAGRAGRDGKPARCCLLYSPRDRSIQEFFIENAYPSPDVVRAVYEYLRNHPDDPIEITQQDLQSDLKLDLSAEGVGTCERLLERSGAIQRLEPQNNMAIVRLSTDLPSLVDLLPKKAIKRRKVMRAIEQIANGTRHEDIYIRPAEVANHVELPMTNVARILRELNDLDVFHYIPPFRGRAIHVTHRQMRFSDLEIDFTTLSERKAADYEKLRYVIRYATSEYCRQAEMLGYFRDPSADDCGSCDNCQSGMSRPAPTAIDASDARVLQTVRMALSGVARAKQRFGKQMIAAMLGGSRSAKVAKWRLDELSTFGLLKSWRQTEIVELLESMANAGLFEQNEVDRFRPVLKLTTYGEQVMRGQEGLNTSFRLPSAILRRIQNTLVGESTPSRGPRDAANEKRKSEVGRRDPPSSDTAPSTQYAALQRRDTNTELNSNPHSIEVQAVPHHNHHFWTWRLADAGFSLDEIAAIRRLSTADVLQHLSQAIDDGHQLNPNKVFSQAMRSQFDDLADSDKTQRNDSPHFELYQKCLSVWRSAN